MKPQIRIVLAEDHQVVREGLHSLLSAEASFAIVGEASDGDEAVKLALEHTVDIVVMDVSMPGGGGIEATRRLNAENCAAAVVILSMHHDATTVTRALRAGARGYVLKGSGSAALCEAIRTVHAGEMYVDKNISEYVAQDYLAAAPPKSGSLTERERDVLELIAEGNTGRQIAELLGIKPKTVENHRANLMGKLGIRTTAGLVRYALKAKLLK